MKIEKAFQVHIKTLNQEKVFNLIKNKKITISEIKRVDKFNTYFTVKNQDINVIGDIFKKNNIEIQDIKPLGINKIFTFFKMRLCVVFTLVLAILLCYFSSFYVFKISVNGTSYLTNYEIIEYVKTKANFGNIISKNQINTNQIELDLMEKFNSISMISVVIKGTTLIINIKEKSKNEIFENQTNDIIANFNGRIKNITLINGKLNVKNGDIVQEGDILVQSVMNSNSNYVKAEANITAEVWLEGVTTHYSLKKEKQRTGFCVENKNINFLGIPIFSSSNPINFANYEVVESKTKLKNTILPIEIHQITYYEMEEITIESNFNDEKEKLINDSREIALQKKLNNDIIKAENVIIDENCGITTVRYVVVVERNIF